MIKIAIQIILALMFCSPAFADDLWPLDKAPWGTSREEVIKLFRLSSVPEQRNLLVLPFGNINREGKKYPVRTMLHFPEGKLLSLVMSVGMPEGQPMTADDRLDISNFLVKTLGKEYGPSTRTEEACENDIPGCKVWEWGREPDTVVQLITIDNERQSVAVGYYNAEWLAEQKKKRK